MKDVVEFRWHGRGGQGAKTAALLLADVAFKTGKYVQGFPEYGPERMGAPITAYNRIGDSEIRVHSNIDHPNFVVVVDEGLLESVDVAKGIKDGGAVVVNSSRTPEEVRNEIRDFDGKVYTIDAKKVSVTCLGKYFPNTPMLAAAVKISGVMEKDEFLREMEASFMHKFSSKPEVIEGNMNALKMAFEEVKG